MHLPEKEDLKRLMQATDLRPADLARLSGVSKPTISKILNRPDSDPSYRIMKILFETVDRIHAIESGPIKEIMTPKVVTAEENEPIANAKDKMLRKNISQLPVLSSGRIVGLITEASTLSHPHAKVAGEAMCFDYVVVSPDRNWAELREMMAGLQATLVVENGKLVGIASRSDFLGRPSHR